ncbi:glycohydrolase toxin TNT-related protein, partial [Yersinia pseudotuberculosis]
PYGYVHNPVSWVDPLGLATCPVIKQRVLDNIAASREAREASNFKQHNEWPPNRGFSGIPKKIELQPGTLIDRYGHEYGTFTSPKGVPYRHRSLKPGTDGTPYNVYEVKEPIIVMSGKAAPWFGYEGGGMQYELPKKVIELVNGGLLTRL